MLPVFRSLSGLCKIRLSAEESIDGAVRADKRLGDLLQIPSWVYSGPRTMLMPGTERNRRVHCVPLLRFEAVQTCFWHRTPIVETTVHFIQRGEQVTVV